MRYILAATIVTGACVAAVLTGPPLTTTAHAQFNGNAPQKTPLDLLYERQETERKENEQSYNTQMKRLKAQGSTSTNSDPWKTVRPTTDSSAKK